LLRELPAATISELADKLGVTTRAVEKQIANLRREGRLRRQLALSREDLARELGVSYTTINRWKNGLSKPSKLARAQLDAYCERMLETGRLNLPEW